MLIDSTQSQSTAVDCEAQISTTAARLKMTEATSLNEAPEAVQTSAPAFQATQVFRAPESRDEKASQVTSAPESAPNEDDELTPTIEDARLHYATLSRKSKQLNNRPLELRASREDEKKSEEKRRAEKWPQTTIRVRFPDQTQIQSSFPSTSKMPAVYDFVRRSLSDAARGQKFTLCEPPNKPCPEVPPQPSKEKLRSRPYGAPPLPPPPETLLELQLVPQAVLVVRFEDEELNHSDRPAPLLPSLLSQAAPLPPPKTFDGPAAGAGAGASAMNASASKPSSGEKKMPKWLQKGLGKR